MIRPSKILMLLSLSLFTIPFCGVADMSPVPVVESVLLNQFPTQPAALARTSESLFQEYEETGNVSSLIFYSYGVLKQASYFSSVNDLIKASEFAKTGFFYLDEAVDSNEKDLRIRYMRARLDAYLTAELGRCVITISDTKLLLENKEKFSRGIVEHIKKMHVIALQNCKMHDQSSLSLIQKDGRKPGVKVTADEAPLWSVEEVTQIMLPLVKGD
ncbi:hypothetical protein M8013_10315 [Enterobacteriaceae bacterium H4N4]|uniref:Uncharacterized protein n=1 Tax=Silvania confinis TaxID=2926470 RepID=A0A9J6QBG1_9ENTR|nr:hypothetical protein [Silvania confinis]MCU6669144.1 hypothetical protein [Silvania confinis]